MSRTFAKALKEQGTSQRELEESYHKQLRTTREELLLIEKIIGTESGYLNDLALYRCFEWRRPQASKFSPSVFLHLKRGGPKTDKENRNLWALHQEVDEIDLNWILSFTLSHQSPPIYSFEGLTAAEIADWLNDNGEKLDIIIAPRRSSSADRKLADTLLSRRNELKRAYWDKRWRYDYCLWRDFVSLVKDEKRKILEEIRRMTTVKFEEREGAPFNSLELTSDGIKGNIYLPTVILDREPLISLYFVPGSYHIDELPDLSVEANPSYVAEEFLRRFDRVRIEKVMEAFDNAP